MLATLAFLIPLPPLAAFAVILLFTRGSRALSTAVAVGMLALSFAGSMILIGGAVQAGDLAAHPIERSIAWIPGAAGAAESGGVAIGVWFDGLTALTLFFVACTLLAIFLYSIGYHNYGSPAGKEDVPGLPPRGVEVRGPHGERRVPSVEPLYTRFFAFVSLFAFGMLLLVLADNLAAFFIGWEVMGLCSYLLIGFWYARESARRAAVKAFLVTRIGDVLMLLGLALCWQFSGSLSFRDILSEWNLGRMASAPSGIPGLSAAGLVALLLLAGTVGKSAQFPLHVWLPDAMEGPTPVSALIHAATMVSAGVYLLLRTAPLLAAAGAPAADTAAFLGAFRAWGGPAAALTQNDVKRVLAYSTVSQLGYMVAAAGIGAYAAAAFHLAVHAFFKALLFLGAGSVIHGVEHGAFHEKGADGTQDVRAMGGLARRMPLTFAAFLAGGLPLLSAGFWSKDEILSSALQASPAVFAALALAALLTAFYAARLITLVFFGEPRSAAAAHASEPSCWMIAPALALAVFAVTAGWIGIREDFPVLGGILPNWVDRLLPRAAAPVTPFRADVLLISFAVSLGGLILGWLAYRRYHAGRKDPLEVLLGPAYGFLQAGCRLDDAYRILFADPARRIADGFVSEWIDRRVLDGALNAIGRAAGGLGRVLRNAVDLPLINGAADRAAAETKRAGSELRALQSGRVQEYLLIGLIAFAACAAVLVYRVLTMP
jgi:NADH-quinone oxidoreductase subunit L